MHRLSWTCPRTFVNLVCQRRLLRRRPFAAVFLLGGCVFILLWQFFFIRQALDLDTTWRLGGASGLRMDPKFVYFYHYLGLFPVTTEKQDLAYSEAWARELVARQGKTLRMEKGFTIRGGELGKLFLYLPDIALSGSAENPAVWPCNALVFIAALEALFLAFCRIRQPLLGLFTVLLLGSHPFQLYEVYAHENVFGWPISTALLVLALHLPLLGTRAPGRAWLWGVPILTGALLATVRLVRTEPVAIGLSATLVYLTIARPWRVRLALVTLLGLAFAATAAAWGAWFEAKFAQAAECVAAAGGEVYRGPRWQHHLFWHPVWCGLGDFDDRYGHRWDDRAAHAYAWPILTRRPGNDWPALDPSGYATAGYWDKARAYAKYPCEHPDYARVLRDEVLGDIARDPAWYLRILGRRLWRVIAETTPTRLAFGRRWIDLPMHGLVFVPLLGFLAANRSWTLVRIAVFLVPTVLPALAIYSGSGMSYHGCHHLMVAAFGGAWLVEGALWARRGLLRKRAK